MSNASCLCINLRSAAQALTRDYDAAIARSGITVSQFSLLGHIRSARSLTVSELAELTGIDRSTLGRNLRLLEKQQLVTLSTGTDARTRQIKLTARGRSVFREAAPHWRQVQTNYESRLGPEKAAHLLSLLQELKGQPDQPEAIL